MAANSADHHVPSTTKCCYSAVLRRLLCSGSLPTHPSDHLDDPKPESSFKTEQNVKQGVGSTNPGVVARLMGLDSFPNTNSSARKDNTLGSFFRSRSVNSIDFISHFEPVKQHRRVRTSVSFREGINYHHDRVSVVSNLEKVDEIREEGEIRLKEKRGGNGNSERLGEKKVINEKQRRLGCVDLSQRKDLHGKKRESLKEKRAVIKNVKSNEEIMPSKGLKKRQKNKNLDHRVHSGGCKVHPERITPGVAGGVSSSRVLSSKIANSRSKCSNNARSQIVEVRAIAKGKKERKLKNKERSCYDKRMVEIICGLAGESVDEDWMCGWVLKLDGLEEICKQLGQEILQVLLKQFVDELVRPTLWHEE